MYVIHADSLDRQAIVERSNGEQYLIEVGVGCLSLQFAEGDTVVIVSRGMFAGIGSRLVLPDRNQDCRILRSERIDSARPNPIRARGLREDAEREVIEAIPLQMQTGSPGRECTAPAVREHRGACECHIQGGRFGVCRGSTSSGGCGVVPWQEEARASRIGDRFWRGFVEPSLPWGRRPA